MTERIVGSRHHVLVSSPTRQLLRATTKPRQTTDSRTESALTPLRDIVCPVWVEKMTTRGQQGAANAQDDSRRGMGALSSKQIENDLGKVTLSFRSTLNFLICSLGGGWKS